MPVKVLFVCLGNICRSPTAHAVFERKIATKGLSQHILVDSAGTGSWHVGSSPDRRTCDTATGYGYTMNHLRARQVAVDDFAEFDYIFAMDKSNLRDLEALCPDNCREKLALFLPFCGVTAMDEVPDPYHGGDAGFEKVLSFIEQAADKLMAIIEHRHRLLV